MVVVWLVCVCGSALCGDLVCCEKPAAWPAGAAHCVFVAGFMEIWLAMVSERMLWGLDAADLSLAGEPVYLFESCACDSALEDAEVLFGVYIERLLVYDLLLLLLGEQIVVVVWGKEMIDDGVH